MRKRARERRERAERHISSCLKKQMNSSARLGSKVLFCLPLTLCCMIARSGPHIHRHPTTARHPPPRRHSPAAAQHPPPRPHSSLLALLPTRPVLEVTQTTVRCHLTTPPKGVEGLVLSVGRKALGIRAATLGRSDARRRSPIKKRQKQNSTPNSYRSPNAKWTTTTARLLPYSSRLWSHLWARWGRALSTCRNS